MVMDSSFFGQDQHASVCCEPDIFATRFTESVSGR